MNKRVLIIGASSGIGKELASQYESLGYEVIITARNTEKLKEIAENKKITYEYLDVNNYEEAISKVKRLVVNTDITIISAGIGDFNKDLNFDIEFNTIKTNVAGFVACVTEAFNYYKSVKKGSIAAISSLASIRGSDDAPAYNASKAFVTNYMDGLRRKSIKEKLNINITTIMPGLVDTQMAKGEGLFWVEPVDLIAKQIIRGIRKKKAELVVSNRWKLIAILLKLLPSWLYYRL